MVIVFSMGWPDGLMCWQHHQPGWWYDGEHWRAQSGTWSATPGWGRLSADHCCVEWYENTTRSSQPSDLHLDWHSSDCERTALTCWTEGSVTHTTSDQPASTTFLLSASAISLCSKLFQVRLGHLTISFFHLLQSISHLSNPSFSIPVIPTNAIHRNTVGL